MGGEEGGSEPDRVAAVAGVVGIVVWGGGRTARLDSFSESAGTER